MMNPHHTLSSARLLSIIATFLLALCLNFLPWEKKPLFIPDFVALMLVFWSVHQPRNVGVSIAFFMGLLMDVHRTTLLGQSALVYTLLLYSITMVHRWILRSPVIVQALYLLPLILLKESMHLIVQIVSNGVSHKRIHPSGAFACVVLWPILVWIFSKENSHKITPDANHPI